MIGAPVELQRVERTRSLFRLVLRPMTIFVASIAFAACTEPGRSPSSPTLATGPPAATAGATPGATAMALGQTVAQVITAADPPCGIQLLPSPAEPCQRFAVSVDRRGVLKVRLTTSDSDELTLRVGTSIFWGRTLAVSASVESGATYEISVAMHGGGARQAFELIATLEPF